jgi:hypothetical protein
MVVVVWSRQRNRTSLAVRSSACVDMALCCRMRSGTVGACTNTGAASRTSLPCDELICKHLNPAGQLPGLALPKVPLRLVWAIPFAFATLAAFAAFADFATFAFHPLAFSRLLGRKTSIATLLPPSRRSRRRPPPSRYGRSPLVRVFLIETTVVPTLGM